jgi:hypothetical protein
LSRSRSRLSISTLLKTGLDEVSIGLDVETPRLSLMLNVLY